MCAVRYTPHQPGRNRGSSSCGKRIVALWKTCPHTTVVRDLIVRKGLGRERMERKLSGRHVHV